MKLKRWLEGGQEAWAGGVGGQLVSPASTVIDPIGSPGQLAKSGL